jgi:uncharacterized OB-fold protein
LGLGGSNYIRFTLISLFTKNILGEVPVKPPIQIPYRVYFGVPVKMVTRKLRTDDGNKGIIVYGYKFRPVMDAA